MTKKTDRRKKAEALADELFGKMKPEQMPSAETLLKALEIAKGVKVGLSAGAIKSAIEGMRRENKGEIAAMDLCGWPFNDYTCNPCDWKDVCIQCDWEDVCVTCDALDCNPGFTADSGT